MFRKFILSRISIISCIVVLPILFWNIYVIFNDDGILTGQVIGSDNKFIAGAKVILMGRTITNEHTMGSTFTDARGCFRFFDHGQYHLVLYAEKSIIGKSKKHHIKLLFRNQNKKLKLPIYLSP